MTIKFGFKGQTTCIPALHLNQKFLILEYVEGQTLSERLAAGPLPLDETLEIAQQIADQHGAMLSLNTAPDHPSGLEVMVCFNSAE